MKDNQRYQITIVEWSYGYWINLWIDVIAHIIENQHRRLVSFLVSVEDGREVTIKVSQACGNHYDNTDPI